MPALPQPTDTSAASKLPAAAIVTRRLRRSYEGVPALRGVDLSVPVGSLCGLIGPNGAGKTTLMSILATLDEDFEGDATIAGVDVRKAPLEVRRRVGFVPDHATMYDGLDVRAYLLFFAAAAGVDPSKRAHVVERTIALCGLEALVTRPSTGLSKGNTQRLCVARALLHDPDVLILDEPAAGLDPRARIELKQLLKHLAKQGKTALVSSHILTELGDFCDHIIVLEKGSVVAQGPVTELLQPTVVAGRRRVIVEVDKDGEGAVDLLRTVAGVVEVNGTGAVLEVAFEGTHNDVANLSKALVLGGYGVLRVQPERANLEGLFLTLTNREVS